MPFVTEDVLRNRKANPMKTHLLAATILAVNALAVAGIASPALADGLRCAPSVAAELLGDGHDTSIYARGCSTTSLYAEGRHHRSKLRNVGSGGLVVGQTGRRTEVHADIQGGLQDYGIDASGGASVDLRSRGFNNAGAVRVRNGGRAIVNVNGTGSTVRVDVR